MTTTPRGLRPDLSGLRIDMILPSMQAGGMEVFVVQLSAALADRGHKVRILTTDSLGPVTELAASRGIPTVFCAAAGKKAILYPRLLTQEIKRNAPHVVHTHTGAWNKGILAARLAHVHCTVHTIHGLHERNPIKARLLEAIASRFTSHVTIVSESLRSSAPSHSSIRLINNGILPFELLDSKQSRESLGIPSSSLVIGTIGRLAPVKNHRVLLSAFRDLYTRLPHSRLVIFGEGSEEGSLRELAEDSGVKEVVHFFGQRSDARAFLRALDVFCLPSLSEGTSIALLEAMYASVPVVASDVGDSATVLDGLGILVDPTDTEGLSFALARAVEDEPWREIFISHSRSRVDSKYSMEACAIKYEELYLESLGGHLKSGH